LLLFTNFNGNTALHGAALIGRPDVLQKIWDMAKDILTIKEIKRKFLLSTNCALLNGKPDVLQKTWDR
jgi:hypothetical protein